MVDIINSTKNATKLVKSFFFLAFYYGFARFLPISYHVQPVGKISKIIRAFACRNIFGRSGENINIENGAFFGSGRYLEIGDNSGIGIDCHVANNVKIGRDVMMGPNVLIIGENHIFDDLNIPMRSQGYEKSKPVIIDDDVWIGNRVIILPGICIGRGAILGAGAVITKDVPPFAICAGNPARVVKFR